MRTFRVSPTRRAQLNPPCPGNRAVRAPGPLPAETDQVDMRKLATRTRLHAVGFTAAFALMVGLSGPAAAAVGQPTTSPDDAVAAALVAAVTGEPTATEA